MTLLAQQELIEPEPLRAVILPGSNRDRCWWGVDASTARLNVGWVCDGEVELADDVTAWRSEDGRWRGVQSVRLAGVSDNEGQRLNIINGQVDQLVGAMLAAGIPAPGVIYLEHPLGDFAKPQLYYTVGTATGAFYEAVHKRAGWPTLVQLTTSSHWKLVATGSAQQPKYALGEKIESGKSKGKRRKTKLPLEDYGVMKWARLNGYTGDSWDDADCSAMAECARREVAIR